MQHRDMDEHDFGLQYDMAVSLTRMQQRRKILGWMLAGGSSLALSACDSSSGIPVSNTDANTTGNTGGDSGGNEEPAGGDFSGSANQVGDCIQNAEETAGPYPSDGSNTVNGLVSNVLNQSGVVRSDIRPSFGISANVAQGTPFTLNLKLLNYNNNCVPLAGYVVYLWHCTNDGQYSLYSSGVRNENFLRGVQAADSDGELTFQTIIPGCYAGRYPHLHFEVYPSLASASLYTNKVQTSQIAIPRDVVSTVYNSVAGYGPSASNLAGLTIQNDGIFGNNTSAQIATMTATMTGNVTDGYTGDLAIGVPGI